MLLNRPQKEQKNKDGETINRSTGLPTFPNRNLYVPIVIGIHAAAWQGVAMPMNMLQLRRPNAVEMKFERRMDHGICCCVSVRTVVSLIVARCCVGLQYLPILKTVLVPTAYRPKMTRRFAQSRKILKGKHGHV